MRLPQPSDLQSDTIKATGLIGLLSAILACVQVAGIYGYASAEFVDMTEKAWPYITGALSYLVAIFRVNYKTKLTP